MNTNTKVGFQICISVPLINTETISRLLKLLIACIIIHVLKDSSLKLKKELTKDLWWNKECEQCLLELIEVRQMASDGQFAMKNYLSVWLIPLDKGRKWNVYKTFRRRPRRVLNVLCTFNLRPVSMGR